MIGVRAAKSPPSGTVDADAVQGGAGPGAQVLGGGEGGAGHGCSLGVLRGGMAVGGVSRARPSSSEFPGDLREGVGSAARS